MRLSCTTKLCDQALWYGIRCIHIVDLAQAFNRFYHDEHILVDNEEEKTAKLAMVIAAKTAIRNGLALLGMEAPERM